MHDGSGVRVVEFQAMHEPAVYQRGIGCGSTGTCTEYCCFAFFDKIFCKQAVGRTNWRTGGRESHTQGIEEMQPRGARDRFRQWACRTKLPDEIP